MANTERLNGARALRRIIVVAVTMATTVAGVVVAPGGHPARAATAAACSEYAQQAVDLFATGRARGCSHLTYPVWSDDYQHHYRWCLKTPDAEVRRGATLRRQQLENCIGQGLPANGSELGPDEVVFYELPRFVGRSASYRVKPGNRWESGHVANLPFPGSKKLPRIGSIRVGSNAAVAFFNRTDFRSVVEGKRGCRVDSTGKVIAVSSDEVFYQSQKSVPECNWTSFLVYRRDAGLAGIALLSVRTEKGSLLTEGRKIATSTVNFFPVPQRQGGSSTCYPYDFAAHLKHGSLKGIGNLKLERYVRFVDAPLQQDGRLSARPGQNRPLRRPARAWVDLFTEPACAGRYLRLPGPGNTDDTVNLKDFLPPKTSLLPRYRSVRVHWTGGNDRQAVATGVSVAVNPVGIVGNMATEAPSGNARKAPEAPDPKTATATGVVTGVIGQGTAPAQATGQADAIHRHELLQVHADRMVFRVHYTLSPQHPMPVYGGAFLLNGAKKGGGFRPVALSRPGTGRFEITVNLTSDRSRPDGVEFFLYEGGQHPFVKKRFDLP